MSLNDISGIKKQDNEKIIMHGREIISGIVWVAISIKDITKRTQIKTNQNNVSKVNPNFINSINAKKPVNVSILGYTRDIGFKQYLHFPFRIKKLIKGILK